MLINDIVEVLIENRYKARSRTVYHQYHLSKWGKTKKN